MITKKDFDYLIATIHTELISKNQKFLDCQSEEFVEGWYRAVGDVELELEMMRDDTDETQ